MGRGAGVGIDGRARCTVEGRIMHNVITFPTRSLRDRAERERAIRAGLSDEGLSPQVVEVVMANICDFLDALELDFTFSLSPIVADAILGQIQDFQRVLDRHTSGLIGERIRMEVLRVLGVADT